MSSRRSRLAGRCECPPLRPGAEAHPLDAETFDRLMAPLGPFEAAPRLAVGVSGGPDSLALTLLAAEWARRRGGRIDALTVDHGLRPESAAEAAETAAILSRHGIPHMVLRWEGEKPRRGVQARARAARHALLEGWCAREGVLHLLLAHHLEDQAETLLLRLGRGSGLAGLAGMAAVVERRAVRLLRPLLAVPKARLEATLAARGERWIADPSNRDPAYGRTRLRALLPPLAAEGLTPARLAQTARRLGRARQAVEAEVGRALAAAVSLRPEGHARLDLAALAGFPAEIRLRALAAVAVCIGGLADTPRLARLERLHDGLLPPEGLSEGRRTRTLGGCLFVADGARALVCREPAAVAPPLPLAGPGPFLWDGRFRLTLAAPPPPGTELRALGAGGWRRIAAGVSAVLPPPVRATLPAFWNSGELLAVPHLDHGRLAAERAGVIVESLAFGPSQPLHGPGFMLV